MRNFLTRRFSYYAMNIEFSSLLETFLVMAIASLLGIRFYLELAGYPKVGAGNFHIAHMLWGGLLMLVAIFLLLIYLNRQSRHLAAIIGGIGFGVFIDELGKFITNDNNYFYKPTVAFIYLIFIGLFFLLRSIQRKAEFTQAEYAINAIEMIKEMYINDLDETERQRALSLLSKSDPHDPLVQSMKKLLVEIQGKAPRTSGIFSHLKRALKYIYNRLIRTEWFSKTIVAFFTIYAIIGFIRATFDFRLRPSYADWGEFIFSLVTGFFVAYGIELLRHHHQRLKSYQMFKNAVLVNILLTQVFLFIKEQFSALIGLGFSIIAYIACQYLIAEEKTPDDVKA